MAEAKWFVTPREFPAEGYTVAWFRGFGYALDDQHDGTFESAQSRADQLNLEEG